jgi:Glycosyl hydrolase family 9/Cellulase N-terminal ig-like domain
VRKFGAALAAASLLVPVGLGTSASPASAGTPQTAAVHGLVRVDQLGYLPGDHKVAYLMLSRVDAGLTFTVVNKAGHTVLTGKAWRTTGSWNAAYPAVYPLDVSRVHAVGAYRIKVPSVSAASPWFRIGSKSELLLPRVSDVVAFFQAQRDGADVIPGRLHRKPSHLNDEAAYLFAAPTYVDPDDDGIIGAKLTKIGGPVDVEGGWFDAGDFIKFAHTAAYADDLLFISQRDLGKRAPAALARETRYGLRWLNKTWDPGNNKLYIQVGIGSGNTAGTFFGDHDTWRLPENDDSVKGLTERYVHRRPVFATDARRGHLAPNLAGRVSAAFALAAQVDAKTNPSRARTELDEAAQIFGRAQTTHVTAADVVTALPHAFYPESAWRDDLELGATELARAAFLLHDSRAQGWLGKAAFWGQQYLAHEAGGDTLNLYDDSAVAHADLVPLIEAHATKPSVRRVAPRLLADLRAQLDRGVAHAKADEFGAGGNYDDFDVASHTFGLAATAALYARVTGSRHYDAFGTSQRDWVLGDNPWGASMMIGVGTTYPACPQHVVANLSGSLTGSGNVLRGAVVNGPNNESLFSDGLGEFFDEGNTCPVNDVDQFAAFTGHGSRFIDDVRSWQTDEPADDFTATAALAFALQASS